MSAPSGELVLVERPPSASVGQLVDRVGRGRRRARGAPRPTLVSGEGDAPGRGRRRRRSMVNSSSSTLDRGSAVPDRRPPGRTRPRRGRRRCRSRRGARPRRRPGGRAPTPSRPSPISRDAGAVVVAARGRGQEDGDSAAGGQPAHASDHRCCLLGRWNADVIDTERQPASASSATATTQSAVEEPVGRGQRAGSRAARAPRRYERVGGRSKSMTRREAPLQHLDEQPAPTSPGRRPRRRRGRRRARRRTRGRQPPGDGQHERRAARRRPGGPATSSRAW